MKRQIQQLTSRYKLCFCIYYFFFCCLCFIISQWITSQKFCLYSSKIQIHLPGFIIILLPADQSVVCFTLSKRMCSILKLFWRFWRLLYLNSLVSLCISTSLWKLWALQNTSKNKTICLGILILGFYCFLLVINLVFLGTKGFIW